MGVKYRGSAGAKPVEVDVIEVIRKCNVLADNYAYEEQDAGVGRQAWTPAVGSSATSAAYRRRVKTIVPK